MVFSGTIQADDFSFALEQVWVRDGIETSTNGYTAGQELEIHGADAHHHDHSLPATKIDKRIAVYGNLAVGVASMFAGGTDTLSVTLDGGHSAADAYTYNKQYENVIDQEIDETKRRRNREIVRWTLVASGLVGAGVAGNDLLQETEHTADTLDLATASASLSVNVVVGARLLQRYGIRRLQDLRAMSTDVKHIWHHFLLYDTPSALLAVGGAALQNSNSKAEQVIAVASGLTGAYVFGKGHDHEHDCADHEESVVLPQGIQHDHSGHTGHIEKFEVEQQLEPDRFASRALGRVMKVKRAVSDSLNDQSPRFNTSTMDKVSGIFKNKLTKGKALIGALGVAAVLGASIHSVRPEIDPESITPSMHDQDVTGNMAFDAFVTDTTEEATDTTLQVTPEHLQSELSAEDWLMQWPGESGITLHGSGNEAGVDSVKLEVYNHTTKDGTIWNIARDVAGLDASNAEVNDLKNVILAHNNLTEEQARALSPGFKVLVPSMEAR